MPDCENCQRLKDLEEEHEQVKVRLLEQTSFIVSAVLAALCGAHETVHAAGYHLLSVEDKKKAQDFRLGLKSGLAGISKKEQRG